MIDAQEIIIPYMPRPQFRAFHDRNKGDSHKRWGVLVAHRRAGKTVACINDLVREALECQKEDPRFAYIAPLYAQAKDVAWAYLKKFTASIPGAVAHEQELRVDLPGGRRIRLYGADNYERLRGIYLDGVVMDEYGDMDPRAWSEVIRPALADRKGWAVFIGTPKGRNHFQEVWSQAQDNPDWYSLMLKASQTGIVSPEELADARASGMSEDQYNQEFECSFDAAVVGAYYGKLIERAENEGRIGNVPWEPNVPVETWWDLGMDDSTAIWFVQTIGREIRVIDYYESSGVGLEHYAKVLKEKDYVYSRHILPHDVEVRELSTGKSRWAFLAGLGIKGTVARKHSVEDGINSVRSILPRVWFDKGKCSRGIEALRQYRQDWDDKLKAFKGRPLHDWTSHGSDAFRYGAFTVRPAEVEWVMGVPKYIDTAKPQRARMDD